jgi:hypothetical protein
MAMGAPGGDFVTLGISANDLFNDPSTSNWKGFVADLAGAVIPGLPGLGKFLKIETLAKNKVVGAAFEKEVVAEMRETVETVVEQITIKTKSGTRTRVDAVGINPDGSLILTEAKSSATATLTKNQKKAFPEIESGGGVVVGKGKQGVAGGTVIPPTKVEIKRKQ